VRVDGVVRETHRPEAGAVVEVALRARARPRPSRSRFNLYEDEHARRGQAGRDPGAPGQASGRRPRQALDLGAAGGDTGDGIVHRLKRHVRALVVARSDEAHAALSSDPAP
jgi:hypothetical protein